MTRTVLTTNYGEAHFRHTVRIAADSSPEDGQPGFVGLATLVQTLSQQMDLVRHIGACPQSLHFFYDNGSWILESTTIIPRPVEA